MGIDFQTSGPLFNGKLARSIHASVAESEQAIAEAGVSEVRTQLDRVLKHPTGRYSRHIHAVRRGGFHAVDDSATIYGPWLAGTGSRNATTRFKGYSHWRRAVQALQRKAAGIVSGILSRRIGGA